MEEALLAWLLADPTVTDLVADRIAWSWRKQGDPVPAIALIRTDGGRDPLLAGGASGFVDGFAQVDCWGALQSDATAVARAVVKSTENITEAGTGGVIQGVFVVHEQAMFDGERPDRLFRTRLSLRIPHNEV